MTDVRYDHLFALTDGRGLFEHACFEVPRPEHGYCVDDVSRGALVLAREPHRNRTIDDNLTVYLRFLADSQSDDGRVRNRLSAAGVWTDAPTVEDCWGRAVWAWGTVAARRPDLGRGALRHFELAARHRSPWSRTMAFAGLGAAEVVRAHPRNAVARSVLADAAEVIGAAEPDPQWRWPEWRLRYANAALAEVRILAGSLLRRPAWQADGLAMLEWLLDTETVADGSDSGSHLSVTPAAGWSAGEPRPGFDQQPIEVAALADACATAFDITGRSSWRRAVARCGAWFAGDNDAGSVLLDPATGAGYDGLLPDGRNENRGAESTIALLTTLQQCHRLGVEVPATVVQ